jgi:hypothetical protein
MCLTLKYERFFGAKDTYKKDVVQQKQFLQDLGLLVVKITYLFNLRKLHGGNVL